MENNQYIIDNTKYFLANDVHGQKVFFDDIQKIVLKILVEFDRVCRKNNIEYALAYGSAIGLVNYGSFIPWDDDADIAVKYEDLPRLVEALKKDLGDDFVFDCYEKCHRYNVMIPTMKIRYKHSYIKERMALTYPNRCKSGNGVFIDIVAFMGVPEDKKVHRRIIRHSEFLVPLYVFMNAFLRITPHFIQRHLKRIEKNVAIKYADSAFVSQTPIIPYQDFEKIAKENRFPRDIIYPFREFDFAGHKFYSFNNPEEFVRIRYGVEAFKVMKNGEYVSLFPMEKRKNKHLTKINLNCEK